MKPDVYRVDELGLHHVIDPITREDMGLIPPRRRARLGEGRRSKNGGLVDRRLVYLDNGPEWK